MSWEGLLLNFFLMFSATAILMSKLYAEKMIENLIIGKMEMKMMETSWWIKVMNFHENLITRYQSNLFVTEAPKDFKKNVRT